MNKKKYAKPCIEVVKLQHQFPILDASLQKKKKFFWFALDFSYLCR